MPRSRGTVARAPTCALVVDPEQMEAAAALVEGQQPYVLRGRSMAVLHTTRPPYKVRSPHSGRPGGGAFRGDAASVRLKKGMTMPYDVRRFPPLSMLATRLLVFVLLPSAR
jgi:hypothetical protein